MQLFLIAQEKQEQGTDLFNIKKKLALALAAVLIWNKLIHCKMQYKISKNKMLVFFSKLSYNQIMIKNFLAQH